MQVRTVTAAAAASREPPQRVHKPDTRDSEGHTCPVHWFVADDTATKIRHFSLQARTSCLPAVVGIWGLRTQPPFPA